MATDEITDLLARLSLPPSYASLQAERPSSPTIEARATITTRPTSCPTRGPGYVVFVGKEPGVYPTWAECLRQVNGVTHNSHKRYDSFAAAEIAFAAAQDRGLVCTGRARAADIRRVIERQKLTPLDLPLCVHFLDDPTSKAMAQGRSKWYVVYAGIQPGVYLTYHECSYSTSGYAGSRHESFETRQEAVDAMVAALQEGKVVKYVLQ